MPPDTLEFEEPIALLLKEVEALSMLPITAERQRSLDSLNMRIDSLRGEIYKNLTPWQRGRFRLLEEQMERRKLELLTKIGPAR